MIIKQLVDFFVTPRLAQMRLKSPFLPAENFIVFSPPSFNDLFCLFSLRNMYENMKVLISVIYIF